MSIHPQTEIGTVTLTVRDLDRMTAFYGEVLGFSVTLNETGAALSVGGRTLIYLHADPAAQPAGRTTGLFHVALLLPSRHDLARFLVNLRYPLQGASDHAVSEALYLADPEGNGLEVYRDRPREEWPMRGDQVAMVTDPLNLNRLASEGAGGWEGLPEGTTIGHIHLRVDDIERAEGFYRDVLGFDVMARYGQQATFMAAGGYHHHIGANVWGSQGAPPAPAGALGLREWSIRFPDEAARAAAHTRLSEAGYAVNGRVTDPSGIRLRLTGGSHE